MKDIIVIENCITPTMQDMIEDEVFSAKFPWFFLENITFGDVSRDNSKKKENLGTHYGFTHVFLDSHRGSYSEFIPFFLPIVGASLDNLNIKYSRNDFLIGRLFLQLPNGQENMVNNAHIDVAEPHYVFLYYVNDSDGDTVIFDKTTADVSPSDMKMRQSRPGYSEYEKKVFQPLKTVTPKKGTVVIFDGSRYHASSNPTTNKRCVVNFNYRK